MKKVFLLVLILFGFFSVLRAESTGEILTFPANPAKGFHWGYALYLPRTIDTSKKLPILLIMTDCGVTDTVKETEEKTLFRLRHERSEYPIADELGVPLVMPIIQRSKMLYTQALSRAVFVSQEEPFKRLDLQVLKMLEDARKELKKRHIITKNKFLVTGFSSAGVFAWRWTMLHPEYVLAAVTGGALYHMLPIEELNGEKLIYPVGVGDLKEYTGKKFNKKAWLKIPILSTNGEKDNNDTFVYEECFAEKVERPVLQKVLPGKDIFERRAQSLQLLTKFAPNVQTHLYPWIGHKPVTKDVFVFLKKHINGGPLHPFTPTDTSDKKPDLPVHIVQIMREDNPNLPAAYRQHLAVNTLVLKTSATHPSWVYREYGKIDILCNGKVVQVAKIRGSDSDGKNSFLYFNLDSVRREMKNFPDKECTFGVRAHYPEIFNIPENLTFSMP